MTTSENGLSVAGLMNTGEAIERLTFATVDELRAISGRLDDAKRTADAILRTRLKQQRQAANEARM